eukprot:m.35716 g.35716  ORF g.35716 m.35716 type:complete len:423 (-) comp17190_c0_seq2:166-1434(-)
MVINMKAWVIAIVLGNIAHTSWGKVHVPTWNGDDLDVLQVNTSHPHPPCCSGCPNGPCTACRTPGTGVCCPCLPPFPPLPPCQKAETCKNLTSPRGYGVSFGMLGDLMVFAGGFKGNSNLDAIDVLNSTSYTWTHAKMSSERDLFAGAGLGATAIFGCGEGDGGGTADIFDVLTLEVSSVTLKGGSRKKCAATSVILASDSEGNPTDGKIIIAGGYKSTAVDVWDLKTKTWSLTQMSVSHFYMASAAAGPFSLFCGGLEPSGDSSLCDIYDARGSGSWSTGNLAAPCREISGSGVTGFAGAQLAVFNGGGHHSVFNASSTPPTWTYSNNTPGRSPWSKMGVTSVGDRYAVFGGGNGNNVNIEIFDGLENRWMFSKYNLSLGREQIMAAGTNTMVAFAGGSIGDYKPTGYTSLIEIFNISALV